MKLLFAAAAALSLTAARVDAADVAPLKIGIIGAGKIGGTLAELWVKAGHEVLVSSRHPAELEPLARSLGPKARAGTPREAAVFGDVVLVSVPYGALPQIGRDLAKVCVRLVVERMHGAPRGALPNDIGDRALDLDALDLHVDRRCGGGSRKDIVEPRNADAGAEVDASHVVPHAVGNRPAGERHCLTRRIVVYDDDSVLGRMDVELDPVCTALEGSVERCQSVLGEFPIRPPVGNALQGLCSLFGSYIVAAGGHLRPRAGKRWSVKRLTLTARTR
jgi:hypothetical protein